MQALRFAIERGDALFGLRDAVAHGGCGGDSLQNRVAALLLLALDFGKRRRC